VALLGYVTFPPISERAVIYQEKRSRELADSMGQIFIRVKINRIILFYTFGPIVLGVLAYILLPNELRLAGVGIGVLLGFLGPSVAIRIVTKRRRDKFENQLVDALMLMSSSLKGGLSILQSIEVVSEEMPDPMRQEFGMLLGENKMGVSLEEAFEHLYERMPSVPLHQMITAILLARETGGNLPNIFSRIVTTIRENRKIKQNLDNLTLQGRLQGAIMSLLPVAFAFFVISTNKSFFDVMFNSDLGKTLLAYAVVSEIIGTFLIWKISKFKAF